MALWNNRHLQSPATSSCKLLTRELNLHELYYLIDDAVNLFASQVFLNAECKVLHCLIRRHKLSYRTHIGYKKLQKFNRCVRLYQEFNYKDILASFLDHLPRKYEDDTYFPSRNMLDYFLVRTQGLGKLIARLFECGKEVYEQWNAKILLGHQFGLSIVIIAVQSRIFVIFQYLLQCICHIYDKLIMLRDIISNTKFSWLPEDYKFPPSLLKWLDIDWVYAESAIQLTGQNNDLFTVSLFDDDDIEFDREYQIISDDEDLQIVQEYMNTLDEEDGIEVLQDKFQAINDKAKKALQGLSEKKNDVSVIDLSEDIGEPCNVNDKVVEITNKMEEIKTIADMEKFIKDSNHTYFRSLGMVRYNDLLNFVEIKKAETEGLKVKKKKKFLKEIKEKIKVLVEMST